MLFARSPRTPTSLPTPTPQTPHVQDNTPLSPENDTTKVPHRWGHSSMMPVDDDCLPEVRQFSDLEVPTHYPLGAIPEAVNQDALPEVKSHIAISANFNQPPSSQSTSRPATASQTQSQPTTTLPPRPGSARRKLWIVLGSAVALLLATIAIALGLGLGLGLSKKNDTPSSSTSSNTTGSPCQSDSTRIFRRTMAAAVFNGSLHIFSRGRDSNIWFRSWGIQPEGNNAPATWTTDWVTLAEGPGMELMPFIGAPTVITSTDGSRMDVFATSTMSGNVNTIRFTKANRTTEWESLGGFGLSSIAICNSPLADNSSAPTYDMWMLGKNSTTVIKNTWDTSKKIGGWDETSIPVLASSGTSPAVICSKHDPEYTVFTFGQGTDELRSTRFSTANNIWSSWNPWGHNFRGDPVAVSVDEGRVIYFFGVGTNSNMYHFTWEEGIESEPRSIGGNWSSIPSAVIIGAGTKDEQIHVVALDQERKLQHRTFGDFGGGRKWQATRWEKLEKKGNSAPLVFSYPDAKGKEQIGLAMLDDDNHLLFATWEASNDTLWVKSISWVQAEGYLINESVCI
ncbi:hypothetical protein QC762_512840 [Podospora pseudocomata]|uniref:PLL-like beta propeller domain-containing protein n=1 Tax=Podospora pseudocomata TaxID=2093779 RepID=A0ABR0GAQ9_9PEZI|nr:hypothetical protein QC762_512840 [Podospora pseudocomata]